jgi:Zn-dependent protease with chaperone function
VRPRVPLLQLPVLLLSLLSCHAIPDGEARGASSEAASANHDVDDPPATAPVPVPEPSDLARAYHRGGNVLWLVEQVLGLAFPALLLFCGWSARLRTLASGWGRGHFYPTLVFTYLLLSAALFVVDLPLAAYAGFFREHAYGLSTQRAGKWLGDQLKGWAVGAVVAALTLRVPYLLLQASPTRWWLWTGLLSLPFLLLTLLVGPLWIAPLFNRFGPMKDATMEKAVLAVAARAGVEGARVFEVEKSVDTKKVNAYVTGVGKTKRVVLWDTLLARLSPRQALFVVGHEAGHYVLGHVWINVLLSSTLILLGLGGVHLTAGALIARFGGAFGFEKLSDPASMPLFILLLSVMGLVVQPPLLALSRHFEREADRFGLELTRDNEAGASAFVRLQEENLAVPRPGLLYTIFRASHPALGDRVDFINGYHPWREGRPLVYGRHFRQGAPASVPSEERQRAPGGGPPP